MSAVHFGTGGWRAVIADGFTKENVRLLSAALCEYMKKLGVSEKGICIGYDRRFLSQEAARWAAEIFAGYAVPVELIEREAPTPLIMYTVRRHNKPFGLAITASHNPAIYNRIKIFTAGGRDADASVTQCIEKEIDAVEKYEVLPSVPYDTALFEGKITLIHPQNNYIDSILALVDLEAIKNARLKIALDPMYGVSKTILSTILLTARCEVDVIHDRHDTLFGGRLPAPNIDTLKSLSAFVTENGCDLGIATDGDADRLGVIDDAGAFLHPNKLLSLLYYYLLEYRSWRGPCVRNNSTTHLLDRIAEAYQQRCYEVPVGFKYVSAKMAETGAIIGGESSGGLTVRGHIEGKDGIYAATLLSEMLAKTGKRLSALYAQITDRFGKVFQSDAELRMGEEKKESIRRILLEKRSLPEFPFTLLRISYEDGCKVYFENGGWTICRFSGTEPLLRCSSEMATQEDADLCVRLWLDFLA